MTSDAPNAAPHPTINVWVENPYHHTSGIVSVEILSNGSGVLSAAGYRAARRKLCNARSMTNCDCQLMIQAGRVRKGFNGLTYVDPGFRWLLIVQGSSEPRTGSAFSQGEAIARAKSAAREPGVNPRGITITQLTYDPKTPREIPFARIIYGANWNPEPAPGCWEDSLHPRAPNPEHLPTTINPGHGEDSEPQDLAPPTFDDGS